MECAVFSPRCCSNSPAWSLKPQLVSTTQSAMRVASAVGLSSWLCCSANWSTPKRCVKSLAGLAACEGKLRHLGVELPPKRSTLAYINQHRSWQLFQTVFDRGYTDVNWWLALSRQKVFFVTRLKDNIEYGVVEQRAVKPGCEVVRDEVILLVKIQEEGQVALMRRIEIWVEEKRKTMVFLTNHLKLAASTIAAVYQDRWQIEQFFRALKQSLRIKRFVGTSANAVLVQIWAVLIAVLLVRYLQMRSTLGWSSSNLVALLHQQLFVYRDLMTWLNQPFESPPELLVAEQLTLEWGWVGQHNPTAGGPGSAECRISSESLLFSTHPTAGGN